MRCDSVLAAVHVISKIPKKFTIHLLEGTDPLQKCICFWSENQQLSEIIQPQYLISWHCTVNRHVESQRGIWRRRKSFYNRRGDFIGSTLAPVSQRAFKSHQNTLRPLETLCHFLLLNCRIIFCRISVFLRGFLSKFCLETSLL